MGVIGERALCERVVWGGGVLRVSASCSPERSCAFFVCWLICGWCRYVAVVRYGYGECVYAGHGKVRVKEELFSFWDKSRDRCGLGFA